MIRRFYDKEPTLQLPRLKPVGRRRPSTRNPKAAKQWIEQEPAALSGPIWLTSDPHCHAEGVGFSLGFWHGGV